jgi:tetratricopeptide (TPR) repeat protein
LRISPDALRALHARFVAVDASGMQWTIGIRTLRWHCAERGQWVTRTPPSELYLDDTLVTELRKLLPKTSTKPRKVEPHEKKDKTISDYTGATGLNDAKAYCKSGLEYYSNKDYAKAFSDFTEAIRLNPNFSDAYYNRGSVYSDAKRSATSRKRSGSIRSLRLPTTCEDSSITNRGKLIRRTPTMLRRIGWSLVDSYPTIRQ